jgi:type IV pilus modification protein PilV
MMKQDGMTLVEVLVAVLILSVGVLGLVSVAAAVTLLIGQGQRYTTASALANQRIEMLRSQDCANLAEGSAVEGKYQVSWTNTDLGNGSRILVTVTSPQRHTARNDSFTTTISCVQ